jgi:hypothetical protein
MKSIIKGLIAITLLLSAVVSNAQIKKSKTETVKIFETCVRNEINRKAGTQRTSPQIGIKIMLPLFMI